MTKRFTKTTLICAIAMEAVLAGPASGQELNTLKNINATSTITIGHRDVSMPFSYFDDKKQAVGYSIDLCLKIVDAIKTTQKLKQLNVKWLPVSAATRIPLLANGTVDMECGATTNTVERQQQVSFSLTTFVASTRMASKKSDNLKTLEAAKGKSVVAVAGTTNLRQITEINAQRKLGLTILPIKHHNDAFGMLAKGTASAFVSDDILLYGIIAGSGAPDDYEVSAEPLSVEPYGIMLRKDDAALKKIADDAIRALFKSGEIQQIYAKWFLSPVPPANIKLNIPMSAALKKVIATPTDSGNPGDY